MSKKGGYVIVDLKGQSITAGTPFTLDGVTARLNRAKNKACLLSGFAIGNEEKRDVFADLQPTADGYAGTIDGYQITIEDDEITFSEKSDNALYRHIILVNNSSRVVIINNESTPFTTNTLYNYLHDNNLYLSDFSVTENDLGNFTSIYITYTRSGGLKFKVIKIDENTKAISSVATNPGNVTSDTVVQL